MKFVSPKNAIMYIFAILLLSIVTVGCGDQPQYIQAQQPMVAPQMQWMQENGINYSFMDPNTVMVSFNGMTTTISRMIPSGSAGWISWRWEDDGDIDVKIANGPSADLDSPFDYDGGGQYADGYYEDAEEGYVWAWMGGKKHKQPKSWLAKNPSYKKKPLASKQVTVTKTLGPDGKVQSIKTSVTETPKGGLLSKLTGKQKSVTTITTMQRKPSGGSGFTRTRTTTSSSRKK